MNSLYQTLMPCQILFVLYFDFQTVQPNINLLMDIKLKKKVLTDFCVICGNVKCSQSSDHQKVSLPQFRSFVENAKIKNNPLDDLKEKVKKFYIAFKEMVIKMLENDHDSIQQHLNRYYYVYLNSQNININDLSAYANENFKKLPQKKISSLIRKISNEEEQKEFCKEEDNEFLQLKQNINKYLKQFNLKESVQKLQEHLPYNQTVLKSFPPLQLRRSQSEISNPEQVDEVAAKTYTYKNVFIKYNSKTLEISNKNITDQQLLRQMPIISSFRNINVLEIRTNKITAFSCRIIASNMAQLKTLDIRSNKIGDQGVIRLAEGLPNLKSFMISQTGCTNSSAAIIIDKMNYLEMFWCQHNNIDGKHALEIANISTLKVLSLAGNKIDEQSSEKIKKIFKFKGYAVL